MNHLNTTDKEIAAHNNSLSSLSSYSSSTHSSYSSDPISLKTNNKVKEEEKPNVYFKYTPTNDSDLGDLHDEAHRNICGASNFSENQDVSNNDLETNGYLDEKLSFLDDSPLPKSLINGIKSTFEGQLIKNYENSSSILPLPTFKSVPGCLDSTIQEDDDEDSSSSSSTSSSSSSSSSLTSTSSRSGNSKSSLNYKKIISNIKSTLSSTQEIISNFKENKLESESNIYSEAKNNIESQEKSSEFTFKDKNNSTKILEGLNKLRLSKSGYDIILVSNDGVEFCCHKCVLVSFSQYFNAMFNLELAESKQTKVTINSLDSSTMGLIVNYAYTSDLTINDFNVQALLTAANLLDIKPVKDACSRYMEWSMESSNCVGIFQFSDTHNCEELRSISFKYILANFTKIVEFEEFLTLQRNNLIEIISDDSLNVINEEIVYLAVIKWLKHSKEDRFKKFYEILQHIRLNLLSSYFLYDYVETEKCFRNCDFCSALIREALIYNLLKDRRNQIQNERTKSRKSFQQLEALVVIGGEDDSVVLRSVDSYFPQIDRWIPLQCSPYALSKHGIVSSEQTIYMCGGEWPDSNPNDTFWNYNSVFDDWKELSSLQIPRSELGLTIVDGFVYAIGGNNGNERLDSVEKYDIFGNTWKYCAPMKLAVSSPGVCSLDGLLYVIGGSILDGEVTDKVMVYNPKNDEWRFLKSMQSSRTGCGVCAFNSKIYVLGGWESSNESLNIVECYDSDLNSWKKSPNMISCRHKPGVAVLQNKIYVCGGEALFNCYHDSIEAFDVAKEQWSLITLMNSGRSWLSCTTLRLQNPLIESEMNNESIKN